jgi:hypothetical protein
MDDKGSFPFLDLPTEIRSKIYGIVCHANTPIALCHPTTALTTTFPHSLLLTCLQLYQEMRPYFFFVNTFSITLNRSNLFLFENTLLCPTFFSHRQLIRSMIVLIDRWGSKDFWVKNLVPVLESMVLNGRLRVLKVLMKEVFLERGLQWLRNVNGGMEGEGANYVALRRLLKDPYLEVAYVGTYDMDDERSMDSCNDKESRASGEFDTLLPVRVTDATASFLQGSATQA